MDDDRRQDSPVRELRLEGSGLYVVGALFLAALAAAFYTGRWIERRAAVPPGLTAGPIVETGGARTTAPDVDVSQKTTYFDTMGGDQKQAEPGREMPPEAAEEQKLALPTVQPQAAPAGVDPAGGAAGPFYVQLFAGRDQVSAESLVASLNAQGYRVRLDTERSGGGSLYKVRVGGYAAKADAQVLAERLRGSGHSGAWVTRVD
jgi:hypothetical protein